MRQRSDSRGQRTAPAASTVAVLSTPAATTSIPKRCPRAVTVWTIAVSAEVGVEVANEHAIGLEPGDGTSTSPASSTEMAADRLSRGSVSEQRRARYQRAPQSVLSQVAGRWERSRGVAAPPGPISCRRRPEPQNVERGPVTDHTAAMDLLVALLDRQADFLLRQTDARAFLIQVEGFIRTLQVEPQLSAYLEDVLQDLAGIVDVMEQSDASLSSELIQLRRELVELRPEADDSDAQAPTESGPGNRIELARYHLTLSFFDECARSEPPAFNADGEGGRAKTMLSILQHKDSECLRTPESTASDTDVGTGPAATHRDTSTGEETSPGEDLISTASDPVDRWRRRSASCNGTPAPTPGSSRDLRMSGAGTRRRDDTDALQTRSPGRWSRAGSPA
jgi:hypothetical protein